MATPDVENDPRRSNLERGTHPGLSPIVEWCRFESMGKVVGLWLYSQRVLRVPHRTTDGVYMSENRRNAAAAEDSARSGESACGIAPLRELLDQVRALLETTSDAQYVQCPAGSSHGSVGGHIRHSLDYVVALLAGFDSGEIDYETRERGTAVENDRQTALQQIHSLDSRLAQRLNEPSTGFVRTLLMLRSDGPPVALNSTFGRETAFVISHTIHHNAMIAAMLRTTGVEIPDRFGYAPGTIAYLQHQPCVR